MDTSLDPIGLYVSIPFCKAKCTYCNFASGVFGPERLEPYVDRLCAEIRAARTDAARLDAHLPRHADTLFFGGGTPSLLAAAQIVRVFAALRDQFDLTPAAEITLECAPGQLSDHTLAELQRQGMNRISLGVQTFNDREAAACGRLHTRAQCLAEITRLRATGISNVNVDLIAGLPYQTAPSWLESIETAIATGVPHVSVYMLEVDDDSRLGREMLASGTRYGAACTPSEDETADWYSTACECLESAGIHQYEISNFARPGHASRHNTKYWRREPYFGFGLDAHSMLRCGTRAAPVAIRRANTSNLDVYLQETSDPFGLRTFVAPQIDRIDKEHAFEEALFLGLRMNEGISLDILRAEFGDRLVDDALAAVADVEDASLLQRDPTHLRLTPQGRMVSNEVFSRLLVTAAA